MHDKAPVAVQHWKTNKVVWTWKDDPPGEILLMKDFLPGRVTIQLSIVITLQLTIFMSMSSLQYTILRCQEYIFSAMKLSQFLQYLLKHEL